MSKFSHILGGVLSAVGLGPGKAPALPEPAVAAAPAPPDRTDVGSTVVIGNDTGDLAGDRIGNSKKRKVGDVLGGLGLSSGLNI